MREKGNREERETKEGEDKKEKGRIGWEGRRRPEKTMEEKETKGEGENETVRKTKREKLGRSKRKDEKEEISQ